MLKPATNSSACAKTGPRQVAVCVPARVATAAVSPRKAR